MNFIELAGQERRQIQKEISETRNALRRLPDIRPPRPKRDLSGSQPGGGHSFSAWMAYQYLIRLDERALRILVRRETLAAHLTNLEKEQTDLDIFILQHGTASSGPDKTTAQTIEKKGALFLQRPSDPVFANVLCDSHHLFDAKRPLHISSSIRQSHGPAVGIHLSESAARSPRKKEHAAAEILWHPASDCPLSGNTPR